MYGQGGFSNPPVKVGEEIEVDIEAVGEKGDGIAKKDGFVLFIPGVKEGDHVRIRVTKVLRKVGFAEVVGEASGAPASESSEEAPAEEAAPVEEAPAEGSSEDTESFGEEEAAEEAPAEDEGIESTEEAPAEEELATEEEPAAEEEPATEDLEKESE